MIKLKEIAEKLGMGISTVSAVLNEKDYCYVSEEKKKLIKDTAKAMGYVPNRMSRGMKGLPTQTIGIIGRWFFTIPLLSNLMNSINLELEAKGYSVLLNDVNYNKDLKDIFYEFVSRGVDGIMLQGGTELELTALLKSHHIPYVIINNGSEGFSVTVDRRSGVFEAVEHMITVHGRRRIGFLCKNFSGSILKLEGYHAALEKHGLDSYKIEVPDMLDKMENAVHEISTLKLDAVFAANDILAALLIKHLHRAGFRVPEDVSVIGFDGVDYLCEMVNPTLSSIVQPVEKIAKKTVNVLLKQIQKESVAEKIYYIKPVLKIAESCGCGSRNLK